MERIHKLTNTLPVIGGAGGAVSQINEILHYFPTLEALIATIILTAVGGTIGYCVKLVLDKIFKCKTKA